MSYTERTTRCLGIFALVLSCVTLALAVPDPSMFEPRQLKQTLCANQNTASMSANTSIWQTNGLCSDFCRAKNYAFAVVQYQSCWCSDVAPSSSSEADVSDKCNDICPGYDVEKCGSRPNYYGYIALGKTPTSTAGGSGDATTNAPSTTQTTSKPKTTIQTVTADGTVRTVTVTPTATGTDGATGASELTPGASQSSSTGPNAGAIAGIVIGVIAGLAALAALGFYFWFRKRREHEKHESMNYDAPSHRGSSAGMTSSPRHPEMVVTVDGGRWDADPTSENRRSRVPLRDPRLTTGMYGRNKSAESINTLRDDQDYSRKVSQPVLRVHNPDPDPE